MKSYESCNALTGIWFFILLPHGKKDGINMVVMPLRAFGFLYFGGFHEV